MIKDREAIYIFLIWFRNERIARHDCLQTQAVQNLIEFKWRNFLVPTEYTRGFFIKY